MKLQSGTIQALYNNQRNNLLYKTPVLQIASHNKISMGESDKSRWKANVSDGVQYMKAVFASDLSSLFDNNIISKYALIKVGTFTIRPKENNNYIYIQSILENEPCDTQIGSPVNMITGKLLVDGNSAGDNNNQVNKCMTNNTPVNERVVVKRATENNLNGVKKMKDAGSSPFTEIKDLNPFQNNWIIKGRVVSKSDIKKFTNAKGEGKLFNFEIADKTNQVKCVAFSETVDIFYPLIELNKIFTISRGMIKMANKKFSSGKFDYEIQLEKNTEIQQIDDDDELPQYLFNFIKIKDLSIGPSMVDVVGVIKEVYPPSTIVVKSTGRDLTKRDLIIVDATGNCRLTLWGPKAEEEYLPDGIIALKSVKVGEFNGVNLSTIGSSQVILDADIPEAIELMGWYQKEGKNIVIERPKRQPTRHLISDVKDSNIEYATVKASIMFIKEDTMTYQSCVGENCNKKVIMEDNGNYRCDRCNYTYPNCGHRFMFSMQVGDFTGQIWISVFDEVGKTLFGMDAKQLTEIGAENPMELKNIVKNCISKEYQISLRIREDNYNGELRKRISAMDISPISIDIEGMKMLDIIEKI